MTTDRPYNGSQSDRLVSDDRLNREWVTVPRVASQDMLAALLCSQLPIPEADQIDYTYEAMLIDRIGLGDDLNKACEIAAKAWEAIIAAAPPPPTTGDGGLREADAALMAKAAEAIGAIRFLSYLVPDYDPEERPGFASKFLDAIWALEARVKKAEAAAASAPPVAKGEACKTCNGHGEIGGFENSAAPGYVTEPCPDCTPPEPGSDSAPLLNDPALEAQLGEYKADAERYRFLRSMKCNNFSLSFNEEHAVNYMSAADWIAEHPDWYEDVPADELESMGRTNTIWRLQVYPVTPIGFYHWDAASLDAVVDGARTFEAKGGEE